RLLSARLPAVMGPWPMPLPAGPPPLSRPVKPSAVTAPLAAFAGAGVVAYAYAAIAYFRVYHRRRSGLAFAVAFAFALLAEALTVAVLSLATSWQLSWWEWHGLMVIGFVSIGGAAWREGGEERFRALYLYGARRGAKE